MLPPPHQFQCVSSPMPRYGSPSPPSPRRWRSQQQNNKLVLMRHNGLTTAGKVCGLKRKGGVESDYDSLLAPILPRQFFRIMLGCTFAVPTKRCWALWLVAVLLCRLVFLKFSSPQQNWRKLVWVVQCKSSIQGE